MNKQFLYKVLELAENYCGSEFSQNLLRLRRERERILNDVWKIEPISEELSSYQKSVLLRDIDYDTIVHQSSKCNDKTNQAALLYDIAKNAINFGEFAKAKEALYIVLKLVKRKDKELTANVLKNIGNVEFYTNNFQSAKRIFKRSLEIFTEINHLEGIISVTNHIGAMLVETGKFYNGEIQFIKARKMAQEQKNDSLIAIANMNLGNVYIIRGLYDDALKCYESALAINGTADENLLVKIYINLAITYKFTQDYKQALDFLKKALEIAQRSNSKYMKALIYLTKAEIACMQGDFSVSTALVTSAFTIFTETGDRLSIADAYRILGMINRQQKVYDVALSYFENSRRICANPFYLAETLIEMVRLYQDMGEKSLAKKTFNLAISNLNKVGADVKITKIRKSFPELT